ncbi:sigma-54-dependent transcriptional regulator [Aliidiomarina maris]|uniref:DNA-binding NtrC family response regulator n=1 Tax=Aliidiomarina maris TaxID=531312 RepID=A0A327WR65_9GAMM|nr:sigma-54 dependent transcriptional regulator [Aliidiomarina maris]RAJ93577.1 DNA-binding NtrC family response regulator [Aliidiomarina maris]RUO18791.1 sigma-54-dependent Fis family transcriptional regulator [Aliidiomarina maris]
MSDVIRIVVVEDDPGLRELLTEELESEGYQVQAAESVENALPLIQQVQPDLVVSDLRLPGANGMTMVPQLLQLPNAPSILLITAFGTVAQAVEALKQGADDFLTKPLDMEHFLLTVTRLLENRRLRTTVEALRAGQVQTSFHGMLGQSRAMRDLYHQVSQVAKAESAVLVLGESGTGKELVARAIHQESPRQDGPFLAVNCAGIPKELMESEFFGHAAGAFTGAQKARSGLLKEAHQGTLLLDEIGEMPLELQAKLLRVLQEGRIRPVGSDQEFAVDVRIIAATHRDLEALVGESRFRQDLFYRLETFSLKVPPLRERGEDCELLAQHFIAHLSQAKGSTPVLSREALNLLYSYPFPGNVRELQNAMERAVTFCQGKEIKPEHLPERIQQASQLEQAQSGGADSGRPSQEMSALRTLSDVQRDYVRYVLREAGGNKRKAAEILGVTRRTLYRWLED